MIVGTHALFQDDVAFDDLALAVIDEQHRFGVHQRLTLAAKGHGVDVLVMTATPIPRTLMLTAYGDMDVSRLPDKPAGRQPVDTRVLPVERLDDVVGGIRRSLDTAAPRSTGSARLVEDSEVLDVAAAEERFDHLKAAFGENAGRARTRPHEGRRQGCRDAAFRGGAAERAGGDHGDRGRRRRARRHGDGHRTRRAVRAWRSFTSCAAGSGVAARPRPACCSTPSH